MKYLKIILLVSFKKDIASTCIFNIVIHKFGELSLIILFKINKNYNLNFYNTILLFNLAIFLRIKAFIMVRLYDLITGFIVTKYI